MGAFKLVGPCAVSLTRKATSQSPRHRVKGRLLDQLTGPAQPLAEQGQQVGGELWLFPDQCQEIAAVNHEQLGIHQGLGAGRPGIAVEHGDLTKAVAGFHDVEKDLLPIGGCRTDAHLTRDQTKEGVPRITLLENPRALPDRTPH